MRKPDELREVVVVPDGETLELQTTVTPQMDDIELGRAFHAAAVAAIKDAGLWDRVVRVRIFIEAVPKDR
jgi:hypothetical protein